MGATDVKSTGRNSAPVWFLGSLALVGSCVWRHERNSNNSKRENSLQLPEMVWQSWKSKMFSDAS